MNHALVTLGDYTVPLIGLPPSATLEECDLCHNTFPLQKVEIQARGQILCPRCRQPNPPAHAQAK